MPPIAPSGLPLIPQVPLDPIRSPFDNFRAPRHPYCRSLLTPLIHRSFRLHLSRYRPAIAWLLMIPLLDTTAADTRSAKLFLLDMSNFIELTVV